jgi:uncharacterized membrane protein
MVVKMSRILRNLTTGRWHLKHTLSDSGAAVITEAVTLAEKTTSAQIKVVIESALELRSLCRNQSTRDRALEIFGLERVWDTSLNNGVLLYLLVSERRSEIVADRGFNGLVAPAEWSSVCSVLSGEVEEAGTVAAILRAVQQIGAIASRAFPSSEHENEISDGVVLKT